MFICNHCPFVHHVIREVVRIANDYRVQGIGVVAIVLSPNKLSALASAGPAVGVGVLGLGLAQIVSQPWFKWACAGTLAVGAVAATWWCVRQYQKKALDEALKEKAELATSTLGKLVPAIDQTFAAARGAAQTEGEKLLKEMFAKFSASMNADEKAVIHQTRAANQTT